MSVQRSNALEERFMRAVVIEIKPERINVLIIGEFFPSKFPSSVPMPVNLSILLKVA
jgi:hypothetical protein